VTTILNTVLLVFPSTFTNASALAKAMQRRLTIRNIKLGNKCIICESPSAVELALHLAKMFGVERVAIAEKVSNKFAELSSAIVDFGTRIMLPGDKFYVKVIIIPGSKCDYVSRDIEFAASGFLSAQLASMNAIPARSEREASRLLLTVVDEEAAYICIQIERGPGGIISGSHGNITCSIHSPLSLLSCLLAAKAGFECPSLVLPYSNEEELEVNAKFAYLFAMRTGRKKQTILATPIKTPTKKEDEEVSLLMKEKIISKILMRCSKYRMILAFTAAVHPIWFIESITNEALSRGKMPLAPLMFLSDELDKFAERAGIALDVHIPTTTQRMLQRYDDAIEHEVKFAIKHTKTLKLQVGPNYLHDVIDSL